MKKQANGKKASAHDLSEQTVVETPKAAKKAKGVKPEERYVVGNISTIRSGFYLELVTFVQKKQNSHGVSAQAISEAFCGRTINGRGINAARVARYLRYGLNHGALKLVK